MNLFIGFYISESGDSKDKLFRLPKTFFIIFPEVSLNWSNH